MKEKQDKLVEDLIELNKIAELNEEYGTCKR